jgi:hypothetical protein
VKTVYAVLSHHTRILLAAGIVLGIVADCSAQYGAFGVFADPNGTNNCLRDESPGVCSYHVVHYVIASGASACQFAAPRPDCFNATYLSDTMFFPVTLGNSQTGVVVGYGQCVFGYVRVLTMNFMCQGQTLPCCCYPVRPDPNAGTNKILVADCWDHIVEVGSGANVINWNPSCSEGCWDCPYSVHAQQSTWGQIKAMYGD